ncbi:MAG: polysaccharide deacetylase family protein, partial [Actinobacteria bacterium]|nr:polysaccharide deacetylase family protein [Actinomycetota bacterium]
MGKKLKNILKKILLSFIAIIFISLLLLFTISCRSIIPGNNNISINGNTGGPCLTISDLELLDINGGDLYPGESVIASIRIINSGSTDCNNIEVKLLTDGLLAVDSEYDPYLIEKLEPDRSIEINIPFLVKDGLTEDSTTSMQILVTSGETLEIITEIQDLIVFGVHPYTRKKIPIIGLHAIEDKIEIPIELYTHHFNVLCQTLKKFGYETITFKDLLDHIDHGRALPEKSVIITSDDGFGDLYTNALPVLKEYDYTMTVFLVTGFIKETEEERVVNFFDADRPVPMRPMLIWPEVSEMYDYGLEFLSHSVNHIHLGLASDKEFLYELAGSKEDIESHLHNEVALFAWPYDNSSPGKIPLLPEAGYRGAVKYSGGTEDIETIDIGKIKRIEFNSYIPPYDYAGYLDLLDLEIENHLNSLNQTSGQQFILDYTIMNNDNQDLKITSFELELSDNLKLDIVDPSGYISQYPGKVDNTFMWVNGGYTISSGGQEDIILKLSGYGPGKALISFRLTAYDTYFNAEDIEI